MALVSVAPTEKTENLVYLLFPTAVALYLATTWTSHVAAWPLLIGIVAPLGGIVLYEIPIDLWVAKEFYRKRIRKGEWSSTNGAEPKVLLRLRKDMAKAYLILRAYENTVTFPGLPSNVDDVHIRDTDVQLQDTVSSHYVHRRLWEVRATIWILVSTPFLIFTLGPLALRVNVVPSSLVMVGTPASAAFLAVLILVFDWNRKKNKFRNDLRYIVFGLFLLYISFCIVFFPPSWNQTNLILTSYRYNYSRHSICEYTTEPPPRKTHRASHHLLLLAKAHSNMVGSKSRGSGRS